MKHTTFIHEINSNYTEALTSKDALLKDHKTPKLYFW